jgi:hypothetical protein
MKIYINMDMKPSAYRSMVLAKERKTKKQDGNLQFKAILE